MRKWIALGLAACMTVSSRTGCGSAKKETEAETTVAESSVEETLQKRPPQKKARQQNLI